MLPSLAALDLTPAQFLQNMQSDMGQNDTINKSEASFESLLIPNWLQARPKPASRPGGHLMLPSIAALDPTRTQLLQKVQSDKRESDKIDKSAADFESLLLTNWLQGAQESFGSVPGGDEEADADPGRGQLQGLAMQSLGTALTAAGGIGLAHSIAQLLHKSGTVLQKPATVPRTPD